MNRNPYAVAITSAFPVPTRQGEGRVAESSAVACTLSLVLCSFIGFMCELALTTDGLITQAGRVYNGQSLWKSGKCTEGKNV